MSNIAERQLYFQPPPGSRVDLGHELGEQCVGWWVPNQYGSATMCDISGKNNHGTLIHAPPYVQGRFGGEWALDYDGANDYTDFGDVDDVDRSNSEITISVWFRLDALPTTGNNRKAIVAKYDAANNQREFMLLVGHNPTSDWDAISWTVQENANAYDAATEIKGSGLVIDTWYHVLVTFKGAEHMRIYLDGVLDVEDLVGIPNDFTATAEPLLIGANKDGTTLRLNGLIGRVAIYSRAFTAQQAEWLHHQPNAPIVTPRPRRSYWTTVAPPVGTPYYYRYLNRLWGETA